MSGYSSYLSSLLTQTTSRYNSLRKILLNNEDDGDTEEDSHISRVLRAYYTEKSRPFPPWLPPDPNDRRAITPLPSQHSSSYLGTARTPYSNVQQASAGNRGSLSDLWDSPAATSGPAQPQSLRAGRRVPAGARPESTASSIAPQARPLPSQRAGSYQSAQPQAPGRGGMSVDSGPAGGAAASAQDRLKARLWGRGGSSGSSVSSASGNPYDQPSAGGGYNTGGGDSRRYGRIQ